MAPMLCLRGRNHSSNCNRSLNVERFSWSQMVQCIGWRHISSSLLTRCVTIDHLPCVTARSLMMLVSCRGMFQKASCSVNLSALASGLSKGSDSTLRVTGPWCTKTQCNQWLSLNVCVLSCVCKLVYINIV